MYEMFHEIPFTKTGADGKLKLHEAAGYMMDVCQFQEYQEKDFCDFLRKNHIAIFLFSIQIDVLRMPGFREKVRTAVKIYGCKSIYGLRRITMHDEKGELCLIANATGAFFDVDAKKAVKLDAAGLPLKFDEAEEMECLPRKIPVPAEPGTPVFRLTVSPSLQDPNGHLTSPVYFALAGDALENGFSYNRIRIEYKKQAKPGEQLSVIRHAVSPGLAVIDIRDSSGDSCAAAEFSRR